MDLTTEAGVVELMASSKSEQDWNNNCAQVKTANSGYPYFWFKSVIQSGLCARTSAQWGGDDQIRLVPGSRL